MSDNSTILITEYDRLVEATDKLPKLDLKPAIFGIFGEVGSLLSVAKKHYRESEAYTDYRQSIEEEFGDIFWYLIALCRRINLSVGELFKEVLDDPRNLKQVAATDLKSGPIAEVLSLETELDLNSILLRLGESVAEVLAAADDVERLPPPILAFCHAYVDALRAAQVPFARVVRSNIAKVRGRFVDPVLADLPTFDRKCPEDEQLPWNFEVVVRQRANGLSYMSLNGVFLGDPLSDNIVDRDGYRFHDVFHFAHAAILHWSPTFRALIKHKRKSDPAVDEAQDGGRAIVVEEGLTAWIFARAKQLEFFEARRQLSFDLLKTIQHFVKGYEVQECPLRLWEQAILQGYDVFRQMREKNGGIVIGNRRTRTIAYRPIGKQ